MSQRVIAENLTLVTAPTEDPINVLEARAHTRITWPDEDVQLEALINAATAHLDGRDGILARALMTQTWDYSLPRFPCEDYIALPLAPVQTNGLAITYKDVSGNEQTFASQNYALSADRDWRPKVHLVPGASWPGTREQADAVKVRAVYGYTIVPIQIRQAILLLMAHLYENREPVNIGNITTELPLGVRALLEPFMRTVF